MLTKVGRRDGSNDAIWKVSILPGNLTINPREKEEEDMKINVKLLRRVAKHIDAEPKRLSMTDWIEKQRAPLDLVRDTVYATGGAAIHKFAPCGTAACIGGWTEILSGGRIGSAGRLLGLDGGQQDKLFYNQNWPAKFKRRYETAKTPRGKANAAIARIEHFIETKGAK
jgi:hypothetical protein